MKKIILFLIGVLSVLNVLLLQGCLGSMPRGWGLFKPKMPFFHHGNTFLDGKNDFTTGFNDGCQTVLVLTSGAFQLLPTKIDGWKLTGKNPNGTNTPHPEIKDANLYDTGFGEGFETCFYYYDWNSL